MSCDPDCVKTFVLVAVRHVIIAFRHLPAIARKESIQAVLTPALAQSKSTQDIKVAILTIFAPNTGERRLVTKCPMACMH